MVPEHYDSIEGCRFADRCPYKSKECEGKQDDVYVNEKHRVKCCKVKEGV